MLALITGASSGIGYDMANYLASLGYDLIVVARREERLKDLKYKLNNINVTIIELDLSIKENCYALYEKTRGYDIDLFINNAGFGLFGEFENTNLETELEMIDLNVKAPTILTKLYLNDFLTKNKGHILNVCSMASFTIGPLMSVYYSTKSYLFKFSMAISEELRRNKSKVKISALCPGPIKTEFSEVAKVKFTIKEQSSKVVAKIGIDKTLKGKKIIIPSFKMKLGVFFQRFVSFNVLAKIGYKFQKKKGC